MKRLGILFIFLLFAVVSAAQDAPDGPAPPGVSVLKLKWSRGLQFPRGWDRPVYDASGPINDPFSAENRASVSSPGSPFPPGGRLPYFYDYTAKIRNDGAKEIKGMIWEYVLRDPVSKKVLGRHRFYSYEKVGANKNATLRGRSSSPPSKVVSAGGLEKDARSPYDERAEVKCVMYADGSWWRHPSAREAECFDLKNREKFFKRMNGRY